MWNPPITAPSYQDWEPNATKQNIISTLDFNLNGIENISSGDTSECESGYVVDNVDQEKPCCVTSSQFEYILPVVFQGPSYLIPFSIEIVDLVVY